MELVAVALELLLLVELVSLEKELPPVVELSVELVSVLDELVSVELVSVEDELVEVSFELVSETVTLLLLSELDVVAAAVSVEVVVVACAL